MGDEMSHLDRAFAHRIKAAFADDLEDRYWHRMKAEHEKREARYEQEGRPQARIRGIGQ